MGIKSLGTAAGHNNTKIKSVIKKKHNAKLVLRKPAGTFKNCGALTNPNENKNAVIKIKKVLKSYVLPLGSARYAELNGLRHKTKGI